MSDEALAIKVTDLKIQRSADSGLMHEFTAKLNGVLIRDIKYFPENDNIMPPSREYISKKTKKRAYWYHIVFTDEQQVAIKKAFKKKLKALDAEDDE